ncbi:MAG: class I SAM-dependent methyltransferase [Ruminococcus sp.]|nr:class I SAM-dependent methyltransferase [Ruminococcus sp.]
MKDTIKQEYLIPTKTCGCCGNKKFKKLLSLYDDPEINYIKCRKCGALTFDRIYSQEGINEMYNDPQYYADYEVAGTSQITFFGAERLAKHIVKYIPKPKVDNKGRINILDFGGGSGEIAYAVAKMLINKYHYRKADIIVVDYNDELFSSNSKNISISRIFPLSNIGDMKFDVVIASAVIEHLPTPGNIMRELFDSIKTGGSVYFRTPYVYPIFKKMKQFGIDYCNGYPGHIWDFDKKWWDNAPKNVGYTNGKMEIIRSAPSIVEKSLKHEFVNAMAAYVLKSVWHIYHGWKYVGGWEAIFRKDS